MHYIFVVVIGAKKKKRKKSRLKSSVKLRNPLWYVCTLLLFSVSVCLSLSRAVLQYVSLRDQFKIQRKDPNKEGMLTVTLTRTSQLFYREESFFISLCIPHLRHRLLLSL